MKKRSIIVCVFFVMIAGTCFCSPRSSYQNAKKALNKHDYSKLEKLVQKDDFAIYDHGNYYSYVDDLLNDIVCQNDDTALSIFYKKYGKKWIKTYLSSLYIDNFECIKWLLENVSKIEAISSDFFTTNDENRCNELHYTDGTVSSGLPPVFIVMNHFKDSNVVLKYLNLFVEHGWKPDVMTYASYTLCEGTQGYNFTYDYPILVYAIEKNFSIEVIQFLVEHGANVNRREIKKGKYALKEAYQRGLLDIYNYLKSKGAVDFEDINVIEKSTSSTSSSVSYSSTPSYSSSSTSTSSTSKLKDGKYTASGTSYNMRLSYGSVTLNEGYSSLGIGTYKIQGNRLVVTWTSLTTDEAALLRGKTIVYDILDDECFSDGNRWVWTGY